ncbi:MAG: hypothetical protein L7S67_10855, partial [Flavobacteriales bacterium]|nr:hypothetical protein [Flavobacteriales bacterium]
AISGGDDPPGNASCGTYVFSGFGSHEAAASSFSSSVRCDVGSAVERAFFECSDIADNNEAEHTIAPQLDIKTTTAHNMIVTLVTQLRNT